MISAKSPPPMQPKARPNIVAWLERVWRAARQALELDAQFPELVGDAPGTPIGKRAGVFAHTTFGTDSLALHMSASFVLDLELVLPAGAGGLKKMRKVAEALHEQLAAAIPDLKLREFPNKTVFDDGLYVHRPNADRDEPGVALCALMQLPADPRSFPPAEELGRTIGEKAKPLFLAAATALLSTSRSKGERRPKAKQERLRAVLDQFHTSLGPELAALKAGVGLRGKPRFTAGDEDRDWDLAWLTCGGQPEDPVVVSLSVEAGTWLVDPEDDDGDRATGNGEAIQIDVAFALSPSDAPDAPAADVVAAWAARLHGALPSLFKTADDALVGFPNAMPIRGGGPFLWTPTMKVADLEGRIDVCLRSESRDVIAPDDVPALVEGLLPAWPAFRSVVDHVRAALAATPERTTRDDVIELLGEAAFLLLARDATELRWEGADGHDCVVDGALITVKSAVGVLPPVSPFTPAELAMGAQHKDRWHVARVSLPGPQLEAAWQTIGARSRGCRRRALGVVDAGAPRPQVTAHVLSVLGMDHLEPDDRDVFAAAVEAVLAGARHDLVKAPFTDQWAALPTSLGLLNGPARLLLRQLR